MTYTDADVQELVKAASSARVLLGGLGGISISVALGNALKPFQPDPDAELVQTIKGICYGQNYSGDERWHHIIAVIRDHDGRQA